MTISENKQLSLIGISGELPPAVGISNVSAGRPHLPPRHPNIRTAGTATLFIITAKGTLSPFHQKTVKMDFTNYAHIGLTATTPMCQ